MNFLITGHSEFAIGMQSALTMIAGEIEDVMIIPFLTNETTEEYRQKIESSIEMYEQVICFTDLLGGTPFKTCVEFSMTKKQVFVIRRGQAVLGHHLVQSFSPEDDLTPEEIHGIGRQTVLEFTGGEYEKEENLGKIEK
ncbi:hypothetical protein FFX71_00285 [Enterococcus faecalis]|nr:hypothetical protein [Enterococcus faecalis]